MSAPPQKLAILFADISGSTSLYEKHGDQKARWLITRCLAILRGAMERHQGTLIKTIGDEILCTFPNPEAAYLSACDMQGDLKKDNESAEIPMYIRIGFHFGDVLHEDGDIYGDAVNVASRVSSITRANQIMTTAAAVEKIPLGLHDKIRKITRADIRGKQEQIDIYQIMWEVDDMASTRIGMSAFRKSDAESKEMVLNHKGKKYTLNQYNPKLLMGRDDSCNIIIKNEFASRQHATIELRHNNFILVDHSSNGTYIQNQSGVSRVSRDNLLLRGSGIISLGQPYSDKPIDIVEFELTIKPQT